MFHRRVFWFLCMVFTEIAGFQRKLAKLLSQKGHLQRLEAGVLPLEAHLQRKGTHLQRLEAGVLPLETHLQQKGMHLQRLEAGALPLEAHLQSKVTHLQRQGMHPFWFEAAQKGKVAGAFCRGMRLFGQGSRPIREMFPLQPPELRRMPDDLPGNGVEVSLVGETTGQRFRASSSG
jgi:exonuclease VII small subunit